MNNEHDDPPRKRIPAKDLHSEPGAEGLLESPAMQPYMNIASAIMQQHDLGAAKKETSALLQLAAQHSDRFHKLEDIEWRINFSVWAFLGGLAYLWTSGKVTTPDWIKAGRSIFLLAPLSPVVLHGLAVFMLNRQGRRQGDLRDAFRKEAEKLLGTQIYSQKPETRPLSVGWRDLRWIAWEVSVTLLLTWAVIFLFRNSH